MSKGTNTQIKPYKNKRDGKTYYKFKIYLGVDPLTGRQKYTTRSRFRTQKEAKLEYARMKLAVSNGTYKQNRAETYQEVYDLWVVQYEKTVEESTYIKTTGIFKNHILPALGAYKIDRMNVDVCQRHVNEWAEKLKKFRTVKSYASKVLDFAIRRGYIQTNPFSLVDMPSPPKKLSLEDEENIENYYTKEQLITFLDCMKQEANFKSYAFFLLLAYSGIRKGEALALTWNDIDFKKNEIRINKAISRGKDNKLYLKTTKTGTSRNIKMDKETMTVLKKWEKKQQEDYLILGYNTLNTKQLVFSNEQNEFLQPTKTRKWLEYVLKKYKLPKITTHGFRHTHCSLLFEAGVELKEVQDRLGHSDIQTTMNIYTHVSENAKDGAVNKLEMFMTM